MRTGPNKWLLALSLIAVVIFVRLAVSWEPSGGNISSPSTEAIITARVHVERVLEAAGLEGARQYSLVCYDSLSTDSEIEDLDRCFAFDLTAANIFADQQPSFSDSWFSSQSVSERWESAIGRMALSSAGLDARRAAIQRSVSTDALPSVVLPSQPSAQSEPISPRSEPIVSETTSVATADENSPELELSTEDGPPRTSATISIPQPSTDLSRPVQPEGQNRWGRRIIENYPSRALRQEIEGTVGISVEVSTDGRVSTCIVTSSSGSPILDEAACSDMQRYARFTPALDRNGKPTTGSWSTRIVYALN